LAAAAFSIAIAEPASSCVMMMILAPLARHWSAWSRCFWASPCALSMT
jgi:hypothetical protein